MLKFLFGLAINALVMFFTKLQWKVLKVLWFLCKPTY